MKFLKTQIGRSNLQKLQKLRFKEPRMLSWIQKYYKELVSKVLENNKYYENGQL